MSHFEFKGVSYRFCSDVASALKKFPCFQEALEFLDTYCAKHPHGESNLSYFIGNPYAVIFHHYDEQGKELREAKLKMALLETEAYNRFQNWMESRK